MSLSQFYFERNELKMMQNVDMEKIYVSNKLIKKEVIDVADLVEAVSKVIVVMN
jgi:hypothetical protein